MKKTSGRGRKSAIPKEPETDPLETDNFHDENGKENGDDRRTPKGRAEKKRKSRGKSAAASDDEIEEQPQKKHASKRKSDDIEEDEENAEVENDDASDSDDRAKTKERTKNKKKKKHSSKQKSSEEEEESLGSEVEEDESEYEVDKIIDEKMVRGVRHYLIRWKGYGPEGDTWEPESTLNCPEAMEEFKKTKKSSPEKGKIKKSKKALMESEEWDENENFEVVRILDVHFKRDGKREFLVSWKGFSNSYDSWEPEENMDCKDMIQRFLKRCEDAKTSTQKELRVNRKVTDRFTLSTTEAGRRLSKRNQGRQRVQYHDAE
ncbi:hypothetical protein HHI36_018863 [Cryptolaemus montrouzieri]|uniref:Chromo domain-containing protein n=1 Tax=Cryptolaemus montrouzieri TaxID=559131 RepID=A0ABD2P1P9_9CUCU